MKLFNWFRGRRQQDVFDKDLMAQWEIQDKIIEEAMDSDPQFKKSFSLQGDDLLKSREYLEFNDLFMKSLMLKDKGSLISALSTRQNATSRVKDIPGLYGAGKHNEMIIEYNHIGRGMDARASALESLKFEDDFKHVAILLYPLFRSNYYEESIDYMTCASTSFEEAFLYFSKLREQFPTDKNITRLKEFKDLRSRYNRWYLAQRVIAGTFYSRVNASMDKGKYAGGLSVLDIILANAESPGYKLDYEEYVDVLDDMCALSGQLLMQKAQIRQQQGGIYENEAIELGCILESAVKYLNVFGPDGLPKDINHFRNFLHSWKVIPWIHEVPGWNTLDRYFG